MNMQNWGNHMWGPSGFSYICPIYRSHMDNLTPVRDGGGLRGYGLEFLKQACLILKVKA